MKRHRPLASLQLKNFKNSILYHLENKNLNRDFIPITCIQRWIYVAHSSVGVFTSSRAAASNKFVNYSFK
jgi:hypothetical protein